MCSETSTIDTTPPVLEPIKDHFNSAPSEMILPQLY